MIMKNSGIEWIGQVPNDWSVGIVKQHFNIIKDLAYDGEPERVLKLARSGIVEKDVTSNEGQMASSYEGYNKVVVGDLLLNPMDLYSGANCNVSELNGVISPAYTNLRAKNPLQINSKFYDYYFKTQYWTMAVFAHGKGVSFDNRWTLNNDTLKQYKIPVVSKSVQDVIVNKINDSNQKIDKLIVNQQEQIEKLKEYKQSVITEAVTKGLDKSAPMKDSGIEWIGDIPENWELNRIKYVCKFNPVADDRFNEYQIVGYAPMECVKNGYMESKEIDIDSVSSGLTAFANGDIIMAKVTPCFENGNIAIADNLKNGVAFGSSELFVFRPVNINTKFLMYYLRNSKFVDCATSTMTGTGGLKRVSPQFVKMLIFGCPSRDEQEQIANYLDKKCAEIDKLILIKQEKIEKLNEYKKSLIYEYVTGKKEVV